MCLHLTGEFSTVQLRDNSGKHSPYFLRTAVSFAGDSLSAFSAHLFYLDEMEAQLQIWPMCPYVINPKHAPVNWTEESAVSIQIFYLGPATLLLLLVPAFL
ncbi:uncharacterized protein [Malus domestica]|uniref:uncharacterized protein n=1 Tax=Malus domestica TaxID=3750 RepID=UPI0010AAD299|nr:uncharacterized protein LOC103422047 isoform X2 [Malus domestica]